MVVDVNKQIHIFLPKTLTVVNGDPIELEWLQEGVAVPPTAGPYGRYRLLPSRSPKSGMAWTQAAETESQTDTIAYVAGTDKYALSEADAAVVTSLTATVGGVANTALVEGTDFRLVTGDGYPAGVLTHVEFIGTRPDDGTSFTIVYTHKLYAEQKTSVVSLDYAFTIHATDLYNGEHGATGFHDKGDLADELGQALFEYFSINRGKGLVSPGILTVGAPVPHYPLPIVTGESVARSRLDARFHHRLVTKTGPAVRAHRKVSDTVTTS